MPMTTALHTDEPPRRAAVSSFKSFLSIVKFLSLVSNNLGSNYSHFFFLTIPPLRLDS